MREFPFSDVEKNVDALVDLATRVDLLGSVRKMKEMVPEYKSKNSVYEQLDRFQPAPEEEAVLGNE